MTADTAFLVIVALSLAAIFLALVIGINDGSPRVALANFLGLNRNRVSRGDRRQKRLDDMIALAERAAIARAETAGMTGTLAR